MLPALFPWQRALSEQPPTPTPGFTATTTSSARCTVAPERVLE